MQSGGLPALECTKIPGWTGRDGRIAGNTRYPLGVRWSIAAFPRRVGNGGDKNAFDLYRALYGLSEAQEVT